MTRRANLTHHLFSCGPQRGSYITKWLEKSIQKAEYFVPCTSCRKFGIPKISFMVTQSYSFVYLLSMGWEKPKSKMIKNDDLYVFMTLALNRIYLIESLHPLIFNNDFVLELAHKTPEI